MVITERELMAAKNGIDSARGREGKNAGKVSVSKLQLLFGALSWLCIFEMLLDRRHNSIRTHTIRTHSRALVLPATINHLLLIVLCSTKQWLWRQFISCQLFTFPPSTTRQSAPSFSFHLTKTDSCMHLIKKLALTRGKLLAAMWGNQWYPRGLYIFLRGCSIFNLAKHLVHIDVSGICWRCRCYSFHLKCHRCWT